MGGEVERLRLLRVRREREPDTARDAAGEEVDLLLAHQLARGLDRLVRLQLVVAEDEFERTPEHAAGIVDLLHGHRQTFLVREGVDGGEAAVRVDLADPDGLALRDRGADGGDENQHDGQRDVRDCSHGGLASSGTNALDDRGGGREGDEDSGPLPIQQHDASGGKPDGSRVP